MKHICIFPCQFRGVLVRQDTIIDLTEEEAASDIGKSSFAPYDAERRAPADDGEKERDRFGMTKQDYRDKLDAFKAVYGPTDSLDQLRKTFERVTSDQPKKRAKPQ